MVHYSVDDTRRVVTCRASGAVDFFQAARALHCVTEDAAQHDAAGILWVFEDGAAVLSLSSVRMLLPLLQAWVRRAAPRRWAIVLPNHSLCAITEEVLPALGLGVPACRCFTGEAEALGWLQADSIGAGRRPAS